MVRLEILLYTRQRLRGFGGKIRGFRLPSGIWREDKDRNLKTYRVWDPVFVLIFSDWEHRVGLVYV